MTNFLIQWFNISAQMWCSQCYQSLIHSDFTGSSGGITEGGSCSGSSGSGSGCGRWEGVGIGSAQVSLQCSGRASLVRIRG